MMQQDVSPLQKVIDVVTKNGIIIFPTDTAFGIGCRIDSKEAVKRLFSIKKRDAKQAVPVLVDSIAMAKKYVDEIPLEVEEKLLKKYWPGALTVVLPCKKDRVNSLVRGGNNTLALRQPDNKAILQIISAVGLPLIGTSANFHGEKTPYEFTDLNPTLVGLVDYVLIGSTFAKNASTIVDCSEKPWKIIRQGAVQVQL
ncbi:MAG: L-threonylcarbamoyladenylate synthase [Candidatus Levyibacteriota bacterium]